MSRGFKDQVAEWTNGGREKIKVLVKQLSSGGHLVTYGGMSKAPVELPTGLLIFKDLKFSGFWVSRWSDENPAEKKRTVEEILEWTRKGEFKDIPVQEMRWDWDTKAEKLKEGVAGTLEGFRAGKGVFVYGDT
ncbi:Enoyl-[acyl-carrier-protein] reductase, mitochondrial [Lachnellula subtilissima]|uniref:Enoyl-[acyl-carrier-protein] reductase, mitochondrial n=1 Tax=Lachnellula subtilissima TaxID=602034 RepID=A0A8H8U8A7_9HELO|nr:Enoyl-[acyl-carrier-protein] reductase, mitochondrial [Lachnellula subtilissima]